MTLNEVEVVVGRILQTLLDDGRLDTRKLNPDEKLAYVRRVAENAAKAFSTMPACQTAMSLAHPDVPTEKRYALLMAGIMVIFGFTAEEAPTFDPAVN